jgi:hypothetical protein
MNRGAIACTVLATFAGQPLTRSVRPLSLAFRSRRAAWGADTAVPGSAPPSPNQVYSALWRPVNWALTELPVRMSPALQSASKADGRELEFILRSLLELKLQVEELRRRLDEERVPEGIPVGRSGFIGEVFAGGVSRGVAAIGPRDETPPPNVVTVVPGTKMTEVERAVIEAALKETRGNRRRAADLLGIGERTLYRKIKEYRLPEHEYFLD